VLNSAVNDDTNVPFYAVGGKTHLLETIRELPN